MSQMPQLPQLSACPSCAEPLESGDNFCGGCGADLSAPPPAAMTGDDPHPTLSLNGLSRAASQAAGGRAPAGEAGETPGAAAQAAGEPAPVAGEPVPAAGFGEPAAEAGAAAQPPAGAEPPAGAGGSVARAGAAGDGPVHGSSPTAGAAAAGSGSTAGAPAPGNSPIAGAPAPASSPVAGAAAVGSGPAVDGPVQAAGAAAGIPAATQAGPADDYALPAPAPAPATALSAAGVGPVGPGGPIGTPEAASAPVPAPAPAQAPVADPRTALGAPASADAAAPPSASATAGTGAPTGGGRACAACRAGVIDKDGYCEHCGHAQPRERDHMEHETTGVAAATDRGLRHHRNEDAFSVSTTALPDGSPAVVAVVCDGVSSATRPDDASEAAANAAREALVTALPRGTHPQHAMHEAIMAAAEAVNALALEPPSVPEHHRQENAPACTIVSAVVAGGILTVGWVGDSRAYWVPDDRTAPTARLTEDDSWAAQMVAAGLMSEAEAYADERAHAITGWLGADAYELEPHTASFKPDRPGVVVVCTDGLWNYAESADEMAAAIPADARSRPLDSARTLVDHALDGGGHDNVTVAVLPFPAPPGRAGSA
ncbi:PP2C family serine/threonine-protein phosphatase [Streptomyces sp. P1-3]|uniref:PP2C family serine/threonine-protein phosphatase n=1 Tax=Streptomyces sp. P1-3 TaxID=3421658 RepID=UPI003D362AF5